MNIPIKIREREKKFIIVGIIIILLILAYRGVLWYQDVKFSAKEHIETKQIAIQKQLNKINQEDVLKKDLESLKRELNGIERALLSGEKPPVAAAEVQRRLKTFAQSLNIVIKSERTLNPIESELYIGIPVEIGFTASTSKLKEMLYKIKTSPLLLTVATMKVRVTNIKNPVENYITLVVNGFIKKTQKSKEDRKEGSIVS
jgi:Tfp pilus assembly protein PilO